MAKGFEPTTAYDEEADSPSKARPIPPATIKTGSGSSAVSTAKQLNPSYGKVPQYLEQRKKLKEAEEEMRYDLLTFLISLIDILSHPLFFIIPSSLFLC